MNRDLVSKIIYYGSLSPSAHNTQPWSFELKEKSIFLNKEKDRTLGYSDPKEWETLLSLGACLGNLIAASKAFGFSPEVRLFPFGYESKSIAEIYLAGGGNLQDKSGLSIIESRQTNRSNYESTAVNLDLVKGWEKFAIEEGVVLKKIENKEDIKNVGEMHNEATKLAFSDKKFRQELSLWIRNSLTKEHDGMPGYSTNIPLPMSFLGRWLIKNFDIGAMQGHMEKSAIISSPLLLIFLSGDLSKEKIVTVGKVFEHIALDITKEGLVYAPLGAIIETPKVSEKLKSFLRVQETPMMLIRVGHSKKKYKPAPKRTLEEIFTK